MLSRLCVSVLLVAIACASVAAAQTGMFGF